jgi:hypothetical protein
MYIFLALMCVTFKLHLALKCLFVGYILFVTAVKSPLATPDFSGSCLRDLHIMKYCGLTGSMIIGYVGLQINSPFVVLRHHI